MMSPLHATAEWLSSTKSISPPPASPKAFYDVSSSSSTTEFSSLLPLPPRPLCAASTPVLLAWHQRALEHVPSVRNPQERVERELTWSRVGAGAA